MAAIRMPPGSRLPALVQTAQLVQDPIGHLERCERRYGPVFRVRLVGSSGYVYVTDPALAREVLAGDKVGALAGEGRRDLLEPLVGAHSSMTIEGDAWLSRRKLVVHAFHRRYVETLEADIVALARAHIESWPRGEAFALRPAMQAITIEVILRLVIGTAGRRRLDRLRDLLPELMEACASPAFWLLPAAVRAHLDSPVLRRVPGPLRRFLRLRDAVDALLYDEIAQRRAVGADDGQDVLSQLMASREDNGRAMNDVELRDELIGLLQAGHDTVATALAWAFERLLRSPLVLSRLRAELDEGDDRYLEAVVKETLRAGRCARRPAPAVAHADPWRLHAPRRMARDARAAAGAARGEPARRVPARALPRARDHYHARVDAVRRWEAALRGLAARAHGDEGRHPRGADGTRARACRRRTRKMLSSTMSRSCRPSRHSSARPAAVGASSRDEPRPIKPAPRTTAAADV